MPCCCAQEPSDLTRCFPDLAADLRLPCEEEEGDVGAVGDARPAGVEGSCGAGGAGPLRVLPPGSHFSSVLRVTSAGLSLWTHYDVMDNVLVQLQVGAG